MDQLVKALSVLAFIAALLGLAAFFLLIGDAKGAPQEASLSAMILAVVVPVYVAVRCVEMFANARPKDAVAEK
jgi:hypothetical protein